MIFSGLIDKTRRLILQDRPSRKFRTRYRHRLFIDESLEGRTLLSAATGVLPAAQTGLATVIANDDFNTGAPLSQTDFNKELATISNPSISGVAFQIRWDDIEPVAPTPVPGSAAINYNLSLCRLQQVFNAADAAGKWVQLLIFPGFWSPSWVINSVATDKFYVQYGPEKGKFLPLPLPLSTNTTYFDDWSAFLGQISAAFETNPEFRMISAAGPTSVSVEFTEPDSTKTILPDGLTENAEWQLDGYTPALYERAWQEVFNTYAADFPGQYISLSHGNDVALPKPGSVATTRTQVLNEASDILGDQFTYQSSALQGEASSHKAAIDSVIDENGIYPVTGFQEGSQVINGSTAAPGNAELALVREIETGMQLNPANGQHVDYLEVHAADVEDADLQPVLAWAASLFDPGVVSLFDQTAPNFAVTVDNDSNGNIIISEGDPATKIITIPADHVTSINIYPQVNLAGHPNETVDLSNTILDTNVPVTITDFPLSDGVPIVSGFNAADDTITIGNSTGGIQGIDNTVNVNSSLSTILTINDSADKAARTYLLPGHELILFPRVILDTTIVDWGDSNIAALTINGSSRGSTYAINGTSMPTLLNAGAGNDKFVITPAFENLGHIAGTLSIEGGGGTDSVIVDDQDDTGKDTYTITASSIQRTGSAEITYEGVNAVTINGGASENIVYNVDGTHAGTPVTINAGTGDNTFNVSPVDQNLDNIAGQLIVSAATGGTNFLNVEDQNAPQAKTYSVTSKAITRSGAKRISFSGIQDIVLDGGGDGNTINVRSTGAGTSTTVNAGSGDDTINVGHDDKLNDIQGDLTVHGQAGTNTLNINDQGAVAAQTYTLAGDILTRSGAAPIMFGTSLSVVVNGSSGGNTFVVSAMPDHKVTLNGGSGNNTLIGPNVASTWDIDGSDAGTLNNTVGFANVANLTGGNSGNDFVFESRVKGTNINGVIDGGSGVNELDYSNYRDSVYVNMLSGAATATGAIENIQQVYGSGLGDVLVGNGLGILLAETAGRNLIIGGVNGDATLMSGSGQDIVIAGSTAYDRAPGFLLAIEASWSMTGVTFAQRVAELSAQNGLYELNVSTVTHHIGMADTIDLGSASDWLFWRSSGHGADTLTGTPRQSTLI